MFEPKPPIRWDGHRIVLDRSRGGIEFESIACKGIVTFPPAGDSTDSHAKVSDEFARQELTSRTAMKSTGCDRWSSDRWSGIFWRGKRHRVGRRFLLHLDALALIDRGLDRFVCIVSSVSRTDRPPLGHHDTTRIKTF